MGASDLSSSLAPRRGEDLYLHLRAVPPRRCTCSWLGGKFCFSWRVRAGILPVGRFDTPQARGENRFSGARVAFWPVSSSVQPPPPSACPLFARVLSSHFWHDFAAFRFSSRAWFFVSPGTQKAGVFFSPLTSEYIWAKISRTRSVDVYGEKERYEKGKFLLPRAGRKSYCL